MEPDFATTAQIIATLFVALAVEARGRIFAPYGRGVARDLRHRITLMLLLLVAGGTLALDGLWITGTFFTIDPANFEGGFDLVRVSKAILTVLNAIVVVYMSFAISVILLWRPDRPDADDPATRS